MRVKQHLVALAGVGHQPERTAGTQLHVGNLDLVEDAPHHQALFAPVKLERLTQIKLQRHEGPHCLAFIAAPRPNEIGHPGIAPAISLNLDLCK